MDESTERSQFVATDTKKDYEVLHRIRLDADTLVRPASEESPGTDEVKTISLTEEEAAPFLATDAIRLVPTRRQVSARGDDEDPGNTPTAPVSPAPPAPPAEELPATLAEVLDEDVASTLEAGGYTTVDQVRSASDEELLAIDGIGPKTLEKIRAAL